MSSTLGAKNKDEKGNYKARVRTEPSMLLQGQPVQSLVVNVLELKSWEYKRQVPERGFGR
ncbi:hypothetical protein NW754_007145 [Fusarium falciforme]|nr:hypothetical protein NW754_007145 [Fusarium falciforme]